jgi:hypothetical protein
VLIKVAACQLEQAQEAQGYKERVPMVWVSFFFKMFPSRKGVGEAVAVQRKIAMLQGDIPKRIL